MKKGKILSALLACSMSVVAASACAFTVGCNKDKGNGGDDGSNTAHVHQWATTWSHDDTNHWHACTADGHTGAHKDVAKHVYDNDQDTTCNTCDYVRTISGGGNEGENPNPPATKDFVTVDMKGIYDASTATPTDKNEKTINDGTALGTNSGLKVVGTPYADPNGKTITYKGETVSLTHRLKLSQKVTNASKGMGIEVNVDANATVIVYYYSGSSNNTRGLELYESDKTTVVANTKTELSDGSNMATAMFSVEANKTYYIGATVAGVNVYYLAVVYGDVGETWTPHEAKAAECGVAGNIAYSESNYGRYKNASGEYIMSNAYSIAAKQHNYTLKAGSVTAASETNPGSATLVCANGHETPVELPVLSSDKYTQVENSTDSAKSDYTIIVDGVEITFTADKVTTVETVWNTVYDTNMANLFYNGLGEENAVAGTGGKTYYTKNKDTDAESAVSVSAADGVVTVSGANTYFALDSAVNSGLIKITGKINVKSSNTGWTFLQLKSASGTEIFGIRAEKNVGLIPRYVGTPDTNCVIAATYVNALTEFEIVIDCTAKTISLKWGGVAKITEASLSTESLDISSLMLNVNTGRTVAIQDLVFSVPQV